MTPGKMENGHQVDPLLAMIKGININDLKNYSNRSTSQRQKEEREVIRRLKIQNKKLLEQVGTLRKQVKQQAAGKKEMMNCLANLQKLSDSLAKFLEERPANDDGDAGDEMTRDYPNGKWLKVYIVQ